MVGKMKDKIIAAVLDRLGEGYVAQTKTIKKNNGLSYEGVIFGNDFSKASPVICIDNAIENMENNNLSFEEIVDSIVDTCKNRISFDKKILLESCKRAVIRVVNGEMNKNIELCRDYLDLKIEYRGVYYTEEEIYSFRIDKGMLELIGMTEEELHETALKNTMKYDYWIENIAESIKEELGIDIDIDEMEPKLYAVRQKMAYGAVCIYTLKGIKELSDKLESDLYVFPSSVNEVICTKVDKSIESYKEMVKEINKNENAVRPEEVLSNSVYIYDRAAGELRIA